MPIFIISMLLALLIVLFIYVCITPSVKSETFLVNPNANIDGSLRKLLNYFGGDVSASIPYGLKKKKRRNKKLNKLFATSGNPWNMTKTEFFVTQVFLGVAGATIGAVFVAVMGNIIGYALAGIVAFALPILGYFYPIINYSSIAGDRVRAFKRDLPEAIDYLVIAMSGGSYALPKAIELSLKYLPKESSMYEEFSKIIRGLNTGQSLSSALDDFAQRAPTPGIQAFVNSLNNANKLNAPLGELLKNRAEASRNELNAEIDRKIATLSTKVLMVFGPMSYVSILIIVVAPVASQLMTLLS